jgi:SET domain-containing protein
MKTSYSRLKPSRIEGAGVGVFSISFIPKGTDPFDGCTTQLRNMSNEEFQSLSEEKKKMVKDFCYYSSGNWRVPQNFNTLDISWFVNSSVEPNLEFNTNNGRYVTLRDIEIDEELTYEYLVYE